ncbi:TetR/AcrR family transcriptional regulator [Chitinophaga skermanii]|nr:TetR/AcrR family transcriptional regulator [Chitinophaga skermanii]
MENKTAKTRERNKDKSKQEFLDAVGKILTTKGYTSLKVNDIANAAGLDKKLIYKYFGGTDQLLDEYIHAQNFWNNVEEEPLIAEDTDGGKTAAKQILSNQFDFVGNNIEYQKILIWQLAEERASHRKVIDEQEEKGEVLFTHMADRYFGDKAADFRAMMALLVSGVYYLNIYAETNGSVFCGIDIKSPGGREKIKEALNFFVDKAYEDLK